MQEEKPAPSNAPSRRELLDHTVHDLKNPLAVVRASLEWLEGELTDREDALDAVRDASTAAEQLIAIVDDLEAVAYIESGRAFVRDDVDLGALVGSAGMAAGGRLGARAITVAVSASDVAIVSGDSLLITRAVGALVDACARGVPKGACMEIEVRTAGGHAEIEIGLRGAAGIAPAAASTELLAHGKLGVYLACRVVEAHGGVLLVVATATMPRVIVRLPRVSG